FLHCVTNGFADRSVRLLLARRSDLTSADLRSLHHTLRLVAVLHGHLPVAALHFFVGDIELGIARSVRCDFCCLGPTDAFLVQVLFDLLPAWTAGFEIFLGVALDLWRSRRAWLNLIAHLSQSQGQLGAIYGRGKLLRPVELMRLQRAGLAVFSLRDIENDHVRM